eukprot:3188220-Amphidinium_carterae.1
MAYTRFLMDGVPFPPSVRTAIPEVRFWLRKTEGILFHLSVRTVIPEIDFISIDKVDNHLAMSLHQLPCRLEQLPACRPLRGVVEPEWEIATWTRTDTNAKSFLCSGTIAPIRDNAYRRATYDLVTQEIIQDMLTDKIL